MPGFPYKPRKPRVPPAAAEPETPQNSDWRLYNAMLRLFFGAAILVLIYTASFAHGNVRGWGALGTIVLALVYLAVPEFRSRIHGSNDPWWSSFEDEEP